MIAPDSKMDRLSAVWSTKAGILYRKDRDQSQTLGIGCIRDRTIGFRRLSLL